MPTVELDFERNAYKATRPDGTIAYFSFEKEAKSWANDPDYDLPDRLVHLASQVEDCGHLNAARYMRHAADEIIFWRGKNRESI